MIYEASVSMVARALPRRRVKEKGKRKKKILDYKSVPEVRLSPPSVEVISTWTSASEAKPRSNGPVTSVATPPFPHRSDL